MDDEQLLAFRSLLERQAIANERIANALERFLTTHQEEKPPVRGRGFGKESDSPETGAPLICVGTRGGGVFYTVNAENDEERIDADWLEFSPRSARVLYKPATKQYSENWKLIFKILTDRGSYRLEFGATSSFARGFVLQMLTLPAAAAHERLLLKPKKGNTKSVVLSQIFDSSGQPIIHPKVEQEWDDIWQLHTFALIQRIGCTGAELPTTAQEYFAQVKASGLGEDAPAPAKAPAPQPAKPAEVAPAQRNGTKPLLSAPQQELMQSVISAVERCELPEQIAKLENWLQVPKRQALLVGNPELKNNIDEMVLSLWDQFEIMHIEYQHRIKQRMLKLAWSDDMLTNYIRAVANHESGDLATLTNPEVVRLAVLIEKLQPAVAAQ